VPPNRAATMGRSEKLETYGNPTTMNFNEILHRNVKASQYYKNLAYVDLPARARARRSALTVGRTPPLPPIAPQDSGDVRGGD